jgi:three-Cys-motif partner protein
MSEQELYAGREQTLVKHFILRKYLERFARIVGTFADSITYVDCFAGPWNVRSDDLKDSSFSIALEELRKARTTLENKGRRLQIRCMFLENDPEAYARLEEFARTVRDAEVRTKNEELANSIDDILQFIGQGAPRTFPFLFVDPTGWTGFEMKRIAPLLRQRPGEVLINFMTDYIRRFIDHPQQQTREQFAALFGSEEVRDRLQALSDPQEREEALFTSYAETVREIGDFDYSCSAIVFYPEIDRRFFHLIYATRHRRGVEVFKEVEQRAMEVQEQTRSEAKHRKRVRKTQQRELFSAEEMPQSRPIDDLRSRYLARARQKVIDLLQATPRVPYEKVWDLALSSPLVWDSDVKDWIQEWRSSGSLRIDGMKPRQRVPKLEESNVLVWQETGSPDKPKSQE